MSYPHPPLKLLDQSIFINLPWKGQSETYIYIREREGENENEKLLFVTKLLRIKFSHIFLVFHKIIT